MQDELAGRWSYSMAAVERENYYKIAAAAGFDRELVDFMMRAMGGDLMARRSADVSILVT